jgi:hypothetical protein
MGEDYGISGEVVESMLKKFPEFRWRWKGGTEDVTLDQCCTYGVRKKREGGFGAKKINATISVKYQKGPRTKIGVIVRRAADGGERGSVGNHDVRGKIRVNRSRE